MANKITKYVAMASLLTILVWRSASDVRLVLTFMVCAGAILIAVQAFRAQQPAWMALFSAIALLFNPVLPIRMPTGIAFWSDLTCLVMFAVSLFLVNQPVKMSIASITDRTPGSESL